MIKLLFVGRRAAGRTRAAAHAHLARVHGRMVVLPPADAGPMPVSYTQHHVIDGAYPAISGAHAIERDLVTEFWFNDLNHLREATRTGYYRNDLAPDEPRFVDGATVEKLLVAPRLLREGERGGFKLLLLVSGRSVAGWMDAIDRTATALQQAGFDAVQVNETLPSPDSTPFVDAVIEAWHADRAAVVAHADCWRTLPIGTLAEPARSLGLAVEVFTAERLRGVDPHTGRACPDVRAAANER